MTFFQFMFKNKKLFLVRMIMLAGSIALWVHITNVCFNGSRVLAFIGGIILGILIFTPHDIYK